MSMQALVDRIARDGKNLGNGILKVDSILNHQIDPELMLGMGQHFASLFSGIQVDRILTAEISGIAPALMTAIEMDVPVVYARKKRPITMTGSIFLETAPSHTKGGEVALMVSGEFLHSGENVLIIDDFLATGKTLEALCRMVETAGANLVGIGIVIEKEFEKGRELMRDAGYDVPIHSLATITSMENERIELA